MKQRFRHLTRKKQTSRNNNYSKTVINPPGGLASIKPSKLNYVKHSPKGGIAEAMKMPNFIKSRKKGPHGNEIIEVDYT